MTRQALSLSRGPGPAHELPGVRALALPALQSKEFREGEAVGRVFGFVIVAIVVVWGVVAVIRRARK